MNMDESIKNVESSMKIPMKTNVFSATVKPEIRQDQTRVTDDLPSASESSPDESKNKTRLQLSLSNSSCTDSLSTSNIPIAQTDVTALETTRQIDHEDRLIRPPHDSGKKSSQTLVNGFIKPSNNNVQLYSSTMVGAQTKNDKPIAEVKPTTSAALAKASAPERKKSIGTHAKKQEKRTDAGMGPNFTPFNDPQKALKLVSVQINSSEWEAAVTGLQNISRLSMFHGKELRASSLQPFVRTVARHIKSLRSQVARAACTAVQKMFSYVPKSMEPDIEVIASALFPRTADTNKFLRVQSAEALNAMVDNVNPNKCVYVITSKGIKHGNRMVRAEACRLLARIVDKLGVCGTLHLPSDVRDAVITAATSMVFDNTPTSRQAAQHILARLSEDPRGVALISSAASPNVKATLNKSLSRIFLK